MERCSAHRLPGGPDWELAWLLYLEPGQQGFFLCDEGHYVVVERPLPQPGRLLATLIPMLLQEAS